MTPLLQIRDALTLLGTADAHQLSQRLNLSLPLVQAMLEQLVIMHKAEKLPAQEPALTGGCQHCPEGKKCRRQPHYRLIQ